MGTKPGFFSRVNQSVKETVSAIKQTASDIYHSKPVTMAKGAVEVLAGVAILALAIKGVMFFGTGTGVAFLGELASALPSVLSGAAVAFTATAQVFAVASVCFAGLKFGAGLIGKGFEDLGWKEPAAPSVTPQAAAAMPVVGQSGPQGPDGPSQPQLAQSKEQELVTDLNGPPAYQTAQGQDRSLRNDQEQAPKPERGFMGKLSDALFGKHKEEGVSLQQLEAGQQNTRER